MVIITAKEYLNRVRTADLDIQVKSEELHRLQLKALQIGSQSQEERVQSTPEGRGFANTIDKIVDLQNIINNEISALVDLQNEAREKINRLSDTRYRAVLTEYYINHNTWEQVAELMKYDVRYIYKIHGRALQFFSRNMKEDSKRH